MEIKSEVRWKMYDIPISIWLNKFTDIINSKIVCTKNFSLTWKLPTLKLSLHCDIYWVQFPALGWLNCRELISIQAEVFLFTSLQVELPGEAEKEPNVSQLKLSFSSVSQLTFSLWHNLFIFYSSEISGIKLMKDEDVNILLRISCI